MKRLFILVGALLLANYSAAADRLIDNIGQNQIVAGLKAAGYGLVTYVTAEEAVNKFLEFSSIPNSNAGKSEKIRTLTRTGILTLALGWVAYKAARKTASNAAEFFNVNS